MEFSKASEPSPSTASESPCDTKKDDTDKKNEKLKSRYIDDMSMFMAWQNYCWMHYSWALYQKMIMQTWYNIHTTGGLLQQSGAFQTNVQHRPEQRHEHQQQHLQRITVKLASIQKRIAAEIIDFLLLAFIKVFVIYYWYGEQYLERFNFILIIDDKTTLNDLEWMLVQALLFRLIIVAYEGYLLSGTLPFSHGCTLGKSIMGIKAVYCADVEEQNELEQTVQITPVCLGVTRSCLRSLLKNISISFLFPMLLPVLMFNHNRLIYDLAVGSLIIEKQQPNI